MVQGNSFKTLAKRLKPSKNIKELTRHPFNAESFVENLTPAQKDVLNENRVYRLATVDSARLKDNKLLEAQIERAEASLKSLGETRRRLYDRKWTSYDNPLVDEYLDQRQ